MNFWLTPKVPVLPSFSAQISNCECQCGFIGSGTWYTISWVSKILFWVTLSGIRLGFLFWLSRTSQWLSSKLAPKQLYCSLSSVNYVRREPPLHEFEKITLKEHLEAVLWAKVEVILNFSTLNKNLSSKTPLSKYKERVLHISHQVLMTLHWLNLKKSSLIKV